MARVAPSQKRRGNFSESKELNLIPIMNLFIVVLPMLLTIYVSVKMTMLEIALSAGGGASAEEEMTEEPPKNISLGLFRSGFEIKIGDDTNDAQAPRIEIPAKDTTQVVANLRYDFIKLDEELEKLKKEHENQSTIAVIAAGNLRFDALTTAIDVCKMNQFTDINYTPMQKKFFGKTK
jgi:biopolymer transport protein ExbD